MRSFERRVRNATTLKNVPSLDTIEKELERVGFIVIDNAFEENVSKECIKEIDEMHFKNVLTPGKIVDKVIDPKTGTYKMYRSDFIRLYFFGSKSNSANERLNHAKIKYAYI